MHVLIKTAPKGARGPRHGRWSPGRMCSQSRCHTCSARARPTELESTPGCNPNFRLFKSFLSQRPPWEEGNLPSLSGSSPPGPAQHLWPRQRSTSQNLCFKAGEEKQLPLPAARGEVNKGSHTMVCPLRTECLCPAKIHAWTPQPPMEGIRR